MHRRLVVGVLLAFALVTGGCVQAVTGDTIAFESSPATVAPDVAASNGYELRDRDAVRVNQTVDLPALGRRDVRITNHLAGYARGDTEGEATAESSAGAFVVVSTPQAKVAGQGTNPLGSMPLREVVDRVASRAGAQTEVDHVGTTTATVLGTETSVEKFASTTRVEGESVETFVYVTRVAHGEDYVVAVGVLPRQHEDDEDAVYAMMAGIEHDDES